MAKRKSGTGTGSSRPKRERKARSVQFDKGTIAQAVADRGLMDVEVMDALQVASSTWFRWKRSDRVPISQVYNVTQLLGLPEPASDDGVPRSPWFVMRMLETLDAEVAQLGKRLERVEAHLAAGGGRAASRSGPASRQPRQAASRRRPKT